MDANRFDRWTRNLARRLSRRDALRLAGAGGASAALATHVMPALAQASCSLQIHAETVAGPSAQAAYDGVLAFTIGDDGSFTQASFTPNGGQALPATGRATGRAIDFLITFGDNRLVSFVGTAAQPLESCQDAVAGTFSGPQPGDLGGWQATTGANAADSVNKDPPSTGGQSTGSAPASTGGQSAANTVSCNPDQTPCQTDAECCSTFCNHASGQCATCNGTVCGTSGCVDPSSDRKNCGACGNACPDNAGACVGGACVCLADGEACTVPAECCSLLCPEGRDICGCSQIGEKCAGTGDCCQPSNGALIGCAAGDADICIGLNGVPCQANTDCLSQNCVNGFCG